MATRCLSIGGSSFLPIRLRRRLNAVRAAARLKQQSFLFNIDLKSGSASIYGPAVFTEALVPNELSPPMSPGANRWRA